jgi:hypothetical protein
MLLSPHPEHATETRRDESALFHPEWNAPDEGLVNGSQSPVEHESLPFPKPLIASDSKHRQQSTEATVMAEHPSSPGEAVRNSL